MACWAASASDAWLWQGANGGASGYVPIFLAMTIAYAALYCTRSG
jgi:hypothetical protein